MAKILIVTSPQVQTSDVTKLVKIRIRWIRISTYKFIRMQIRMQMPL